MSFIFGEGTGLTYDDLKRRQSFAEAMMVRGASGAPKTAMQGASNAASSIMGALMARKLGAAEKAGQQEAGSLFNAALGGIDAPMGGPLGSPMGSLPSMQSGPAQGLADDAMRAVAKAPRAEQIRQGLVARGLPEHVADGFLMNMKDESGLNPSINERNPIVPGSRGGFGLIQWTGPRRKQLEAAAAQRGVDPSDVDLQLDFLVDELKGPESAAAQSIFGSSNAGEAATAIVREFLRPAQEHRDRRVAQYSNGDMGGIASAMANPYMSEQQRGVLGMLMQQRMSQRDRQMELQMQADDPMRQMQLQKGRLELEQMQNPRPDPLRQLQLEKGQLELQQMRNPQPKPTDDIREYEFARQQGYEGTFQDFMVATRKAGATSVNVNTGESGPQVGTIPQGYELHTDPQSGALSMRPIPGGPEDMSEKTAAKEAQKSVSTNLVMDEISIARDLINGQDWNSPTTGITGSLMSRIDSSDAGSLKNRLQTIKANIGFDKLQAMREASPTGGALGAVSEFENRLLQSVYGSLEQAQSADDLSYNLDRLEQVYTRIVNEGIPDDEAREMYREIVGGERTSPKPVDLETDGWRPVNGVWVREKK